MLEFGIERSESAGAAYLWHSGFAASNTHITKLDFTKLRELASSNQLFSSKRMHDGQVPEFACIVYYDLNLKKWFLGGLMSSEEARGNGVAETLCCLALGRMIAYENPFGRGERICTYVSSQNPRPVGLLNKFGFTKVGTSYSNRKSNGAVGKSIDEYELTKRQVGLKLLSKWSSNWKYPMTKVFQEQASLKLPFGDTPEHWKNSFDVQARYGS